MRHTLLFTLLLAAGLAAQPNAVPGTDARLADTGTIASQGRLGTYPNGMNGLSAGVTVCNIGTTTMDWYAAMDPRHPVYSFILCRESDGRFEQISDWSYVKHGFSSINANFCGTCRTTNSRVLGPACSDTYGTSLNANRYYLGPPAEIDPWLGAWNPVGSHFDRGEPDVGPPQNMDGQRSLTSTQVNAMDPVTHRIEVADQDLAKPNSRFYYGIYVVVAGEPEANRENNMITREVATNWSGSRWNFSALGIHKNGTILGLWSGAQLTSVANGNDDGRFHLGVRATGPDARGMWHYEYAIHNRDNHRGGAGFRIPVCPDARVENLWFRDIDGNAVNDWTATVQNGEIAFLAPAGNALEWNTIYNFAFDCDAAPTSGMATIDQARPGPGALQLQVATSVPGLAYTPYVGPGCGAPAPVLLATGSPAIPSIPSPTYGLRAESVAPNASIALLAGFAQGSLSLGNGCTLLLQSPINVGTFTADGQGVALMPQGIPNLAALEGGSIFWQAIELQAGGPLLGVAELSNAVQTRIGNRTSGCR
ncbi:MAG: hypothetical protein IPM29_27035 [Planctomycetes bacterium]|nr:hypothetical protein [Planctomycetota bacterium]